MNYECFEWDYKEQPPMDEIGVYVESLSSLAMAIFWYEIDTQSSNYALVITNKKVSYEEALALWSTGWDDEL